MRLTTFSDYTLRVLIFLALNPNRTTTISEIAAAYDISNNHLMKVVNQLAHTGRIETIRGKGGGIRLVHDPKQIRIGDVIRISEGSSPIVECMSAHDNTCRITPGCRLSGILAQAFDALYTTLNQYTLADLIDKPRQLTALLTRLT